MAPPGDSRRLEHVSDRSAADRLYALHCLEQVQLRDLERTRRWIEDAQRQVSEEERRLEREAQPPPEWMSEQSIGAGPPTIHTTLGDRADACWDLKVDHVKVRPILREQALRAIDEAGATACERCRPDTELGILG